METNTAMIQTWITILEEVFSAEYREPLPVIESISYSHYNSINNTYYFTGIKDGEYVEIKRNGMGNIYFDGGKRVQSAHLSS